MGRTWSVIVAILASLTGVSVRAADRQSLVQEYSLASWTQKDGLPPGQISPIVQDRSGFLWLGTPAGLYRFDGIQFVDWNTLGLTPLPTSRVTALAIAPDGAMWVGFGNPTPGVARIERKSVSLFGSDQGYDGSSVSFILPESSSSIWLGTSTGLHKLEGGHWRSVSEWGLPKEIAHTGLLTRDGSFVVAMSNGIYRRRSTESRFEQLERFERPAERFGDDIPSGLIEDERGRLLVTDQIGGYRVVGPERGARVSGERGRGAHFLKDHLGNLWLGTLGQGVWRIKPDATEIDQLAPFVLLPGGVSALFEDRDGNLWLGTGEGLNRLSPHKVEQITRFGPILAVEHTPNGDVWLATADELIGFPRGDTDAVPRRIRVSDGRVQAFHADQFGNLWIDTERGLARVDFATGRLITVNGFQHLTRIRSITTTVHGDLWMYDVEHGLFHSHRGALEHFSPFNDEKKFDVSALYADNTDNTWIGLRDGRIVVVSRSAVRILGPNDGLNLGTPHAFYEDKDRTMWIACENGLIKYRDGSMQIARARSQFPAANLTAIIEDRAGFMWVGSGAGLLRFDRKDLDAAIAPAGRSTAMPYLILNRFDGVAGLPYAYNANIRVTNAADGRLWFVTSRGVSIVDPTNLAVDPAPILVQVDTLTVDDHVAPVVSHAEALPAGTRLVVLNYSVLSFASTVKQQVRYRLDGFDTKWTEAGLRRQAFYTNLPAGTYRFRVMVSSSEHAWPDTETFVDFSVKPHVYETKVFAATVVVFLALLAYALVCLRARQIRRQFGLVLAERARLSREIHDTLLQGLVFLALHIEAIAHEPPIVNAGMHARFIRLRRQIEQYIRDARQSIGALRSGSTGARDLVTELRSAAGAFAEGRTIALDVEVSGEPVALDDAVTRELIRIGDEAISNAVRHADPQRIRIVIAYRSDALKLSVADDGRGFDPQAIGGLELHFGLATMKERAKGVGASLHIDSGAMRGTTITVELPLPRRDRSNSSPYHKVATSEA